MRYPCRWTTSAFLSVGPEGLEPSQERIKSPLCCRWRLDPDQSARRESNPGHRRAAVVVTLIRGLLLPLSYAPANRAGGTRTHTCRIKSPVCCRYTTTLCLVGRMRFNRVNIALLLILGSCQVVALRIELSATWLSAAFGQPALGYRVVESGWQDSNLRLRAPKARGFAATLHPARQSERPRPIGRSADRCPNRRSPAPRAGAIPRLRYVLRRAGLSASSIPTRRCPPLQRPRGLHGVCTRAC